MKNTVLRLLFAGSPAIALPSLTAIAETAKKGRWILAGILTNPDKARGRGGSITATEIGQKAALLKEEFAQLGINPPLILKYETLKADAREAVSKLKPNLLVSFAYGRIFGPKFMALFPLGGINIHPSLLPKYRGASPIQETILNRDSETGISIQRIAPEMDTGNILAQEIIPLYGRETASSLGTIAAEKSAQLLCTVLEQFTRTLESGKVLEGILQEGEPSYCSVLEKTSGIIDWTRSAVEIDAQIRACNPWPLAQTSHGRQILNILEAVPYAGSAPCCRDSGSGGPSELSVTAASAGPTPCCSGSDNMLTHAHAASSGDIKSTSLRSRTEGTHALPGSGGPSELSETAASVGPTPCCKDSDNTLDVSRACPGSGGPSELSETAASAGPTPCCSGSDNMLTHALPGRVLGIDKKSGILIQTGNGIIAVSLLQYQNKKVLPWHSFLNGARDFISSRLG